MKLISRSQALLEIAPAYFAHMATTHNKATALAKIVGFYTGKLEPLQEFMGRTDSGSQDARRRDR